MTDTEKKHHAELQAQLLRAHESRSRLIFALVLLAGILFCLLLDLIYG